MLEAVNNLKFNVTERKLLDWNETYDEIQGDTKVVRVGKYLKELPLDALVDKSCGLGGTTYALTHYDKVIIVMPLRKLINQKLQQFSNAFKVEEGVTVSDIENANPSKIITTYHSFYKLLDAINISEYVLVVDEFHTIVTNYNAEIHKPLLNSFKNFKNYVFISATFPDILPTELRDIRVVKLKKKTIDTEITLYKTSKPIAASVNKIKAFLEENSDKKLVVFVNSVHIIEQLLDEIKELDETNCNVYYSNSNDIELRLSNCDDFSHLKTINFITSCGFVGVDINEVVDEVFFISVPNKKHTLYSRIDIEQAIGRFRNNKSINIIHIFKDIDFDYDASIEALNKRVSVALELSNKELSEEACKYVSCSLPLYKGKYDEDAVIAEQYTFNNLRYWNDKTKYNGLSTNVFKINYYTKLNVHNTHSKKKLIEKYGEEYVNAVGYKNIVKMIKNEELLKNKINQLEQLQLECGKYYAVKDVDIKLLKGLCDFKVVTHRLNGVPTRCLFINAFIYKKI